MEPCEQKTNIEKLFELSGANKDVIAEMRIVQAEIKSDVRHTKQTIENGLKSSVSNTEKILIALQPVIDSHAEYIKELREKEVITKVSHAHVWAKRIEATCVASAWGICITGTGVIVWALSHGFKP